MSLRIGSRRIIRRIKKEQRTISYDYYIDPVNGNDSSGDGSLSNPYKTIAKGLTTAGNDETIGLLSGIYREKNLAIAETGLTIGACTGAAPVWVPTTEYTSWSKTGGQTNVYEAVYPSAFFYGAWDSDQYLALVADVATCDSTSHSCYFDNDNDKVYVNIGGETPTSIDIRDAYTKLLTISGTGCTLTGITFKYFAYYGIDVTGNSNIITNCTFSCPSYKSGSSVYMVQLAGSGNTISSCTWLDCGAQSPIRNSAGENSISNVTITGAGSLTAYGIRSYNASTSVLNVSDTVISNVTNAFHVQDEASLVCTNCKAIQFYHCGFMSVEENSTLLCHKCSAYLTSDPGIHAYGYIAEASGSTTCYHCIAANLKITTAGQSGIGFLSLIGSAALTLRNCIAYECKLGISISAPATCDDDYCCGFGNTTAFGGTGVHNITSDPKFSDPDNRDYTLQTGSPCIDAGVAIEGYNDGYLGDAPDIGRYEKVP